MNNIIAVDGIVVKLPKWQDTLWKISYFVFGILSFSIISFLFHQKMYNRNDYLTRKNLLNFLEKNDMSKFNRYHSSEYRPPSPIPNEADTFVWSINNIYLLYFWERKTVALSNINGEVVLCSYQQGRADIKNYNKIKEILIKDSQIIRS